MKVGNDICIICRGSGAVTQEHICPECDGLGYIKVEVNNNGEPNVQEHSEESGRDDRRNHSKNG